MRPVQIPNRHVTMQPLADIKVLDLTWHVAGPYATKLLADWGADVVKVERPGLGDPARSYGPFPGDEPHLERSGTFLHLNTNKRSVTVNMKNDAGGNIIRRLVAWADVVVENFSATTLRSIGLDYESLRRIKPDIVMCSISNFGADGRNRDWKGNDFTISALAGLTSPLGGGGDAPLKSPDHLQEYQAGTTAAVGIMGAVFHRDRGGIGQHIDVSVQEQASNSADRRNTFLTGYAYIASAADAEIEGGIDAPRPAIPIGIYPCKDGYVSFLVSPPARWTRLVKMLGRPDLVNDPELRKPSFWIKPEAKDLVDSLLYPWVLARTKQEVMEAAQESRIACAPVNSTIEVLADEHWQEREYWAEADHTAVGRLPYTGPSYRAEMGGWALKTPAPLLGQHNVEVYVGLLGFAPGEVVLLRAEGAI